MRAKEFIIEYKMGTVEDFEGVDMKLEISKLGAIVVKALDDWGNEIGRAHFNDMDGEFIEAQSLWVEPKSRGQGVARKMYDFVTSHGYEIHRSPDLTKIKDQGKQSGEHHWQKNRGENVRVWEEVNPDIYHSEFKHEVEIGDYRYTAETDNNSGYGNQLIIKVYDGNNEIANAEFIEEPHDKALISANTWVQEEYEGQGIATNMYAYAKMLGNDIIPSWNQTDAGERMWRSWNQSGQSKHILPKGHNGYHVNESLLKSRNLNPDTEQYVKSHKWKLTTVNPMDLDVDSFDDPYGRVIDIDVYHPVNFKDPIIVDNNGVIIDGFHRAYQAQRAGLKTIPAYVPVQEQLEESTSPVVYHGNQGGIHRELITPMWWTESKEDAISYATQGGADGWVYSATLSCKNPYVIKPTDETNTVLENWKRLQQQGYDSIYDESVGDWIPFYSKDIHLVGKPEYQEER